MGQVPARAGKKDIINHCNTLGMCSDEVEVVFDTTPRIENDYLNKIGL
jgi:hypothetical protein